MTAATKRTPAPKAPIPPAGPTLFGLTAPRDRLSAALSRALLATPSKTTLPALQCVRLERRGNELRLTSTDIERTISLVVPLDDEADLLGGDAPAVLLPAKRLHEIVSSLPPGAATITLMGSAESPRARITGGRAKYELVGIAATEFPNATASIDNEGKRAGAGEVDGSEFGARFAVIAGAATDEESRQTMQGVLVECTGGKMILTATNGHRLMTEQVGSTTLEGEWIIHKSAASALSKLFSSGTVEVTAAAGMITFAGGTAELVLRLVNPPYPPWRQIMSIEPNMRVTVDRAAMLAAVERMRPAASGQVKKIRLDVGESEVAVRARHEDSSLAEDVVAADVAATGDRYNTWCNPDYLAAALRAFDTPRVTLLMQHRDRAFHVTADPADNPRGTLALIMPLRGDEEVTRA